MMNFPYYTGKLKPHEVPKEPAQLPLAFRAIGEDKNRGNQDGASDYIPKYHCYDPDPNLVDACNVALLIGQPLLLTGEPGTGKTTFASHLAWQLGFPPPVKFETKSNSQARDLFYTYDTLQRFQDSQEGGNSKSALEYITYQALGSAILRTKALDEIKNYLSSGFKHIGKTRSIVLIDEIDKAPRDFPNDILNEIEQLYFRIPELGNKPIVADPALQPIVIITSNSEKDLPDAFLRRCVYYHIPFPKTDRLLKIVSKHLALLPSYSDISHRFLRDSLSLFNHIRENGNLLKKPATAELLNWIVALKEIIGEDIDSLYNSKNVTRTMSSLLKKSEDLVKAEELVQEWITLQGN